MKTYTYQKQISNVEEYELAVVGGGMGGVSAAISASRLGLKTVLIENTGCLGGMATSGLVNSFDGIADGEKSIVCGIMLEIVETLYKRGDLPNGGNPDTWRKRFLCPTRFHPESLKVLLDDMAIESGVTLKYFSKAVDATKRSEREAGTLIISSAEGMGVIEAKAVIDATGDGHVSHFLGAKCEEAGEDTKNIMPATLCFLGVGIDWEKRKEDKTNIKEYAAKAKEEGFFKKDYFRSIASVIGHNILSYNAGHLYNLNALKTDSLTNGMIEGRKIAKEYIEFYKRFVKGYENHEIASTASLLGVRESRRVEGEYRLTFNDFKNRREFPDQIGVFNKEIDIHSYTPDEEAHEKVKAMGKGEGRLKEGEYYGIPYGVTVVKGFDNLWTAGRCVSSDEKIFGSLRVMPAASMTGEGVGVAAYIAIKDGVSSSGVNTRRLVETLRTQNVYLPQKSLCERLTRE